MAAIEQAIVAKLKLDSKEFKKGISETDKALLAVGGSFAAAGAAAFGLAKTTADFQDKLIKSARATGTTVEAFSALSYAAGLSGVETETLAKSLNKLNAPSASASAALKALGVSTTDAQGNAKSADETMAALAGAFEKLPTGTQKAQAALDIFGAKGAQMVNLLDAGKAGLEGMLEEAERLGVVVSTKAAQASEKFNDDLSRLGTAAQGAGNAFGETIVQIVNSSGALDIMRDLLAGVTGWWRSLGDETKKIIGAVIAVAGGFGALIAGIVAFNAVAPLLGTAITAATGGLSLVAVGIAALVAGLAAIAVGAVKYWDQVKEAIEPARASIAAFADQVAGFITPIINTFKELGGGLFEKVKEIVKGLGLFGDNAGESTKQISILGTVTKTVMAVLATVVNVAITPFKIMFDVVSNVLTAIYNLGDAVVKVFQGEFEAAGAAAGAALDSIGKIGTDVTERIAQLGEDIKKTFEGGLTVEVNTQDIERAKTKADELAKATAFAGTAAAKTKTAYESFMDTLRTGTDAAQTMSGAFSSLSDALAAGLQREADVAARNAEIATASLQKRLKIEREALEKTEDEKIQRLTEGLDAEIEALKRAEAAKLGIIENAANERLLAMDSEFQAAKALKEKEFQDYVLSEQAKYEAKRALVLQATVDQEQDRYADATLTADWQAYLQDLQNQHETSMSDLASEFAANRAAVDAESKAQAESLATTSADKIKALELAKDEAIKAANDDKIAKMAAADKKAAAAENRLKKDQIRKSWQAQLDIFNQTKAAKYAEVSTSGIAAAAQAFAALFPIPVVGPALAAAAAATVMAATGARLAGIEKQKPIKPAELMMERGGYLGGGARHSGGGIPANLERGEAVIDRTRTARLYEYIDRGASSVSVVFAPGSVSLSGGDATKFVDEVSRQLTERLNKSGVVAAGVR